MVTIDWKRQDIFCAMILNAMNSVKIHSAVGLAMFVLKGFNASISDFIKRFLA